MFNITQKSEKYLVMEHAVKTQSKYTSFTQTETHTFLSTSLINLQKNSNSLKTFSAPIIREWCDG
jgi:hypothetical protein